MVTFGHGRQAILCLYRAVSLVHAFAAELAGVESALAWRQSAWQEEQNSTCYLRAAQKVAG